MNLANLYRSLAAVCPVVSMLLGGIPIDAAEITFSFANAMSEGKWHGIIDAPNQQNYMTALISASHPSDSITVEALPGNYKITFIVESGQKIKTSIGSCVVSCTDNPETITLVSPQKIYKNGSDISFSGAWNFTKKDEASIADNTPVIRDILTPATPVPAQTPSEAPSSIGVQPKNETQPKNPLLETPPKIELTQQPSLPAIEDVNDVELSNQSSQFKDSSGYCDSFVTRAKRYTDTIVNVKPIHYDKQHRHTYYDTTSPEYCDEFINAAGCNSDEEDVCVEEGNDYQISNESASIECSQDVCNAPNGYCDELIEHPSDDRLTSMFVYPLNRKKHVKPSRNSSEYCDNFIDRFGTPIDDGSQISTLQECQKELMAPLAIFHISYPTANSEIVLDYGSSEKVIDNLHTKLTPIEVQAFDISENAPQSIEAILANSNAVVDSANDNFELHNLPAMYISYAPVETLPSIQKDIKNTKNTPHNLLGASISIQALKTMPAIAIKDENFDHHTLPALYISYAPIESQPIAINTPISEPQKEDVLFPALFISYADSKISKVLPENDKGPSLNLNAPTDGTAPVENINPFNISPAVDTDNESAASLYDSLISKDEELEITETTALHEVLNDVKPPITQLENSKIPQTGNESAASLYFNLLTQDEELEITETKALHEILGVDYPNQLEFPKTPQAEKQIEEPKSTDSTPSLSDTDQSEYSDHLIQRNEQSENAHSDALNPCVSFFMKFINRKYGLNTSQPNFDIENDDFVTDLSGEIEKQDSQTKPQEPSQYSDHLIQRAANDS